MGSVSSPMDLDLRRCGKRCGAWWVIENGNGMLRLRCALYNGTFQRVFDNYTPYRHKLSIAHVNSQISSTTH